MRRVLASVAAAAIALTGIALAAPAAHAIQGGPLGPYVFGLQVPGIANGVDPTVNYGSVRLWDAGVAWGQVEQARGQFWWDGLDHAIQGANAQKVGTLYVLGGTPTWAATNPKQGTYPYPGAASMPSMQDWTDWVTAVTKRYANSIESYQIWNEANLQTFWMGTPAQMAQLTAAAAAIIKQNDPTARIVAASSTVRLQSAYKKFFPAYLKELAKLGWPITDVSAHFYPASTGTPATRATYIAQVQTDMRKAGVPATVGLWDTEINYAIAGPTKKDKHKNIPDATAAAYVAQTYLDNVRLGVARAYWYSWNGNPALVGIPMQPGSAAATAYNTVYGWLKGAFYSCTTAQVNTCQTGDNNSPEVMAWASGKSGTFIVPPRASITCNALNQCSPVTPGAKMTIGSMPQWFGTAAPK